MSFSDISSRLKVGIPIAVFFAFFLIFINFFPQYEWTLRTIGFLLLLLAAWEYVRVVFRDHVSVAQITSMLVLLTAPFFQAIGMPFGASLLSGLAAVTLTSLIRGRTESRQAFLSLSRFAPGLILIGLGGVCLLSFSRIPAVLFWLIWVVSWNDVGAYFIGSMVGGPKLCPGISPGKTVSGSMGGFVVGILASILFLFLVPLPELGPGSRTIGIACVLIGAAQAGDLMKSLVKREFGVKDFGTLLQGHGGVLDRLDGVLFAAPFVAAFL